MVMIVIMLVIVKMVITLVVLELILVVLVVDSIWLIFGDGSVSRGTVSSRKRDVVSGTKKSSSKKNETETRVEAN